MAKAQVILDEQFAINNRYRVVLYPLKVPVSRKYPTGIKAKFVLIDVEGNFPRLLVDNHEPYGFHMHTRLPEDSSIRIELSVKDRHEALDVFLTEVERIIDDESK